MIRTIARYGARHVRGSMAAALKVILHGDGLRGPSIAEFEKRFADYHGIAPCDFRLLWADGVLLHFEVPQSAARLRNHLSSINVLGCAGNGASARIPAEICGYRSGNIQYRPGKDGSRDNAQHTRGRPHSSLRAALRDGTDHSGSAHAWSFRDRRLRTPSERRTKEAGSGRSAMPASSVFRC